MMNFIVLYHAPKGAMEKMAGASPEDAKKGMEPWMAWAKKCGEGLLDMGAPLGNAHKMSKTDHGVSESTVVGYSILQAESWGRVKEMIENHPHLMMDDSCTVEVHEALPLPGM